MIGVNTNEQVEESKAMVESIQVSLVTAGAHLREKQFNPRSVLRPEEILHG